MITGSGVIMFRQTEGDTHTHRHTVPDRVDVKFNFPRPTVCKIKVHLNAFIVVTLNFDLKDQGHILFPLVDYVGAQVKSNSL